MMMKIVSFEFKTIDIGKFYPKEGKLELDVTFYDGSDKELSKIVSVAEPHEAAFELLEEFKRMEKMLHAPIVDDVETMDQEQVNVVVKQEEEFVKDVAALLQKASAVMDKIRQKKEVEGYLDLIQQLRRLKINY